jgi:hypothetical protein
MTEVVTLLAAASISYMLLLIVRELHVISFTLWQLSIRDGHKDETPNN